MARFSSKPPPRPLWCLLCGSLVVGQEFALTCLLLTRHRAAMQNEDEGWRQVATVVILPLVLILVFGEQTSTPTKRACDALLLAGMLRLVSSVLKTLTASYSSDTVYALAIAGMIVHLLACDYGYARGQTRKKAAGIVSLNACLFSTTLLASRLTSNATVYVFVSTSVILFAFYPSARHTIAVTQPHATFGTCYVSLCEKCLMIHVKLKMGSCFSVSSHQYCGFTCHMGVIGDSARKVLVWRDTTRDLCGCSLLGICCATTTQSVA